ncbi:PAP/25A associated domain family [Histoplasma capsulatum G186AR]|uniref:polynucleotide adenylyltransferase n=1 Tax=Ajellomyces capsulatus TaxID=5037 RepID=A0A8H7YGC3_AJECA|nr:PAP/25A associated domain family [Histoplasma capsulatum]QSS72549.1 PAP/25A associated domain family [Histoplasma capsulatum G186AR]
MKSRTHGNAVLSQITGDLSPIAPNTSSEMAWAIPADLSRHIPPRPPFASQHSSSLPSTPYQHPRGLQFVSRSPSPNRRSSSPRSTHSESTHLLPSLRRPYGGCKYETGMAHFRRRIPYSLGSELLPKELGPLKDQLDSADEKKLSGDMRELYDRLLPSEESESRRLKFVDKLENLLNKQWPGNNIRVHVFGSSGNKLCSSDSDVDICITTTYKELEKVCILADFLAKSGMERVVCVSHARVPIVKIWDPELRLACDMNVNNTLALENTRMIRTYVEIDERVRQLAMIVKYWTKRRILNDAALGGTLSSYTWICLIINFLQTRNPPILPSLQERRAKQPKKADDPGSSFDDDMEKLSGFGQENKSSLGELLFQFFRYYGHEVDYETKVMSVRMGTLISKEGKGWHLLQNNRLCVEEPFNTSRNLGNTADDTSFRGLHMELRRAFSAVAEGKLDECCEQYEYPPEEERNWERPPPQPRPILAPTPAVPSRGGRGGGRGGRHNNNHYNRGQNTGRRSSSSTNRPNNTRHTNPSFAADIALQAQQAQQAQYLLHDHLYQQIQILQAQEQELRMQLQNQALISGRAPPTLLRQPYLQFPFQQDASGPDENSRARAGTVNHPPLTAPVRQHVFYNPSFIPIPIPTLQGATTDPPSPSTAPSAPDTRRNHRRSSVANGSPRGPLRAQSQPARPLQSPVVQNFGNIYQPVPLGEAPHTPNTKLPPASPKRAGAEVERPVTNGIPMFSRSYMDESRASEYVGYYLGDSPQSQATLHLPMTTPHSIATGLAIQNSGLFSHLRNQADYHHSMGTSIEKTIPSTEQAHVPDHIKHSKNTPPCGRPKSQKDRGPLIVDGSLPTNDRQYSLSTENLDHFAPMSFSTSASEDRPFDTSGSPSDTLSQGFPDHAPYDEEYEKAYGRGGQATQPQHHINGWDSTNTKGVAINGHLTLSERLQRYQISDTSRSSDWHGKMKTNQHKGAKQYAYRAENGLLDKDQHGPHDNHVQSSNQLSALSPVKETRTVSPTTKRRVNGVDSDRSNGSSHRNRQRGRHDSVNTQHQLENSKDKQTEAHHRKPNGVPSSTNGAGGNEHHQHTGSGSAGWQTTTKKKNKRGNKTPAEPVHNSLSNGVEPLPADESLRKGG